MNTPSHFILQAALAKRYKIVKRNAFLWGAVAPDVPLYLLSVLGALYFWLRGTPPREALPYMFDTLFYDNPFWIASHNMLHSPTMLLLLAGGWWLARRVGGRSFAWFIWLIAGCAVHTLVDIPTHYNDGPLLFFPLEWTTRFSSPVSYWDPAHYGVQFTIFELSLDIALLVYLLAPWFRRRFKKKLV